MTERELWDGLARLCEGGRPHLWVGPEAPDVLGALRPPGGGRAVAPPEPTGGVPAPLFQHGHLVFTREDHQTLRVESTQVPAGGMLFVGCGRAGTLPDTELKRATPFHRAAARALGKPDPAAPVGAEAGRRARALVALTAQISDRLIRESLLRDAYWCARDAGPADSPTLTALVAAQYPGGNGEGSRPDPAAEPDCVGDEFRGRFVVLRDVGGASTGRVSADAFPVSDPDWVPILKVVHFVAEVEVAPTLLLLSLREALALDPASAPSWRAWAERELVANPALSTRLLEVLAQPGD